MASIQAFPNTPYQFSNWSHHPVNILSLSKEAQLSCIRTSVLGNKEKPLQDFYEKYYSCLMVSYFLNYFNLKDQLGLLNYFHKQENVLSRCACIEIFYYCKNLDKNKIALRGYVHIFSLERINKNLKN